MNEGGGASDLIRARVEMHNRNALKIGFFGANCSSGRSATLVPERWTANWSDCLALALLADEAGVDFLLPIARWKGYGGGSDFQGTTLETLTWASGLLAATRRITVFGTVHAPLFHPLIAAKEMVTADQIGGGRFGLNLVAGWNEGEFAMFGVEQRGHENRYDYAQEWIDIVKRAWTCEDFDFDGRYFHLAGVRAKPGPVGGQRPVIMNAGQSERGRAFAMQNCDAFFTSTSKARLKVAGVAPAEDDAMIFERIMKQVSEIKAEGRRFSREVEVYTQGQVICRPMQHEAEEYRHYSDVDCADWEAIEQMLALKNITARNTPADEFAAKKRHMASSGSGGYRFVGTPDKVASEFAALARAGFRGFAISFVNYLREAPYFCAEVLPRLARMGLRAQA